MRKNATKLAAAVLSLAMVMTSVNMPASAAKTKVKLNKTKATLYVNGSASEKATTLKVTVNGKKVNATFKSSNTKVLTVAKKTGKVTAKKNGTAKVTATYKKKKYNCTVTVKTYATSVSITSAKTLNLAAGKTATIKATVKPSTASNKKVSFTSSNKNVATVTSAGKVTAKKAGTATVTVKALGSKKAAKKATVKVNVKAAVKPSTEPTTTPTTEPTATPETPVATEGAITVTVANGLKDYPDTVLVNESAQVEVTVKDKEGNILANKPVNFFASKADASTEDVQVLGSQTQQTDANGKVTFYVALKNVTNKATDSSKVTAANYTVYVPGNESASVKGTVKFAALDLSTVVVPSGTEATSPNYNKLVAGTNAQGKVASTYTTKSLAGKNVLYIPTQQVSHAVDGVEKEDHAVTFSSTPSIQMPSTDSIDTKAKDFNVSIDKKCGKYNTYAIENQIIKLEDYKVDARDLLYATLNFKNVKVSKYTKLTIQAYSTNDCLVGSTVGSASTIYGEYDKDKFEFQIPKNGTVKAIKVTVESEGQVQTNMNDGYVIDNIKGVYKETVASTIGTSVPLKSASIDWKDDDLHMSDVKTLKNTDAKTLGIPGADTKDAAGKDTYSYKYQVPVFPYTGNAVIKEYDSNGKVTHYYLAPTVNKTDLSGNNTNENDIDIKPNNAYLASKEEAETKIGTVIGSGNSVVVNSTKVGVTNVKGTISLDRVEGANDVLDATNKYIYTSVQWNPLPNDPNQAVAASDKFMALAGQNVKVIAQLTDQNNNPVAKADQQVTFKVGNNDIPASASSVKEGIAIVKQTKGTDVNGQVELVLNSAQANMLADLSAKTDDGKYNVALKIGDKIVTKSEIYWVDANLSFTDKVVDNSGVAPDVKVTNNDTKEANASAPDVNTPWMYAVETVGSTPTAGQLNGFNVKIDGLKIATSYSEDNKGKYTPVKDAAGNVISGAVEGTSEYVNTDVITNEIDGTSISKDVKFIATKGNETYTLTGVGEGIPNLNAKLNINVPWKSQGKVVSIVSPTGTRNANNTVDLYVKVTDGTGKNVLKDTIVTFKSGNTDDVFADNYTGSTGTTGTTSTDADGIVKTDNNGVAKVTLTNKGAAKSSVVTATVDGVDQPASTTINWVDNDNTGFGLVNAEATDAKTIKLTFNNNVEADSVKKEMFNLTDKDNNPYDVVEAKANGKYVILSLKSDLKANLFTVKVEPATVDGIEYNLVSDAAIALVKGTNDSIQFYSEKKGDFSASVNSSSDKLEIKGIKSPVAFTGIQGGDNAEIQLKKFIAANLRVVIDGTVKTVSGSDVTIDEGKGSVDVTLSNTDKRATVYFLGTVNAYTIRTAADANANAAATEAANKAIAKAVADINTKLTTGYTNSSEIDLSTLLNGTTVAVKESDDSAKKGIITYDATANKIKVKAITASTGNDDVVTFEVTVSKNNGTAVTKKYKLTISNRTATYTIASVQ